ncbi:MAG: hypothetical protein SGBAC_008255 [Bacillariaceae sp.]
MVDKVLLQRKIKKVNRMLGEIEEEQGTENKLYRAYQRKIDRYTDLLEDDHSEEDSVMRGSSDEASVLSPPQSQDIASDAEGEIHTDDESEDHSDDDASDHEEEAEAEEEEAPKKKKKKKKKPVADGEEAPKKKKKKKKPVDGEPIKKKKKKKKPKEEE